MTMIILTKKGLKVLSKNKVTKLHHMTPLLRKEKPIRNGLKWDLPNVILHSLKRKGIPKENTKIKSLTNNGIGNKPQT
jgi:hypothetical protein